MLPVPDPAAAQLECTIWDEEDKEVSWFGVHVLTLREGRGRRKLTDRMFHRAQAQGYSNFLGEVLLNLARLAPYKGHYIEQVMQQPESILQGVSRLLRGVLQQA